MSKTDLANKSFEVEEEFKPPAIILPNLHQTVEVLGNYEYVEVKQENAEYTKEAKQEDDAQMRYVEVKQEDDVEAAKQKDDIQIEYVEVKQEPIEDEYFNEVKSEEEEDDDDEDQDETFSEKSIKQSSTKSNKNRKRPFYECKKCFEKFVDVKGLKKHRKEVKHLPKGDNPISCPVCNKMFGERWMKRHMRTHTGEKPYCCDICGASFIASGNLNRHKLALHSESNDDQRYQCQTCEKYFKHLQSLKAHQKREEEARLRILSKDFQCTECDQAFTTKTLLERHSVTHGCNLCGKVFSKLYELKTHQRMHTEEKPYACRVCSKSFMQPSKLEIHVRIHTGEKPYTCEVCSKAFTQSTHLKDHMRLHTGEKPYSCDVCGKDFTKPNTLKIHMRRHTGEKPYRCEVCRKGFASNGALTIHKRTHTGEKPFICPFCGKAFHDSSTMRKHERGHGKQNVISSNELL